MPLFGDFICPAVCLYVLNLPSFYLNPMIPCLGARPDFHRNNLYVVSWSSSAVYFSFQNLLDRCRNVRQKIISCSCFDNVNAGKVCLPFRIDAVDIWRIDGNDAGACCNAAQIFGSISQHNRYLQNMCRHGNVSTINSCLITA